MQKESLNPTNSSKFSYRTILSENRSFLMGLAIIFIAIYHVPNHTTLPLLGFLQRIGYGGTDIFILLSGFGACHSLSKSDDAYAFLIRRLKRLLPSYLPFIIVWMVVQKILVRLYFTEICGNLTMTGWWNGDENQFNWYIDCILVFYILAPYIYKAIKGAKNQLLMTAFLILLSLLTGCAFMHGIRIIAVSRLPLFILGFALYLQNYSITRKNLSIWCWNIIMILGFALMYILTIQTKVDLWHYGLHWYPFLMITPGFCMDLSILSNYLKRNRIGSIIYNIIKELGNASFEIFLIHLFIYETFMKLSTTNAAGWTLLFISALILGYLYYLLTKAIKNVIGNKYNSKIQ